MRAAPDMPRRRRRGSGRGRGRIILIVGAVVLFVLVTSLRGIASFYTDFLWFDSLGLSSVFTGILGVKIGLGAAFTAVFFVLCFANLTIADRLAPRFRPAGPEDDLLNRYHQMVDRRAGLVRAGVSLLFGLIAGVGQSTLWNQWILFRNGGSFGTTDATFNTDVGFYIFKLPFLSSVVSWLFATMVIILLITAVAHYLNGGIRLQSPFQRVTPAVKGHLSVLLAVLALIKAGDYWLQRYQLTLSTRGVVNGATYTDVHAVLPATYLLLLIALLSCALLIVNIWRRGWVLPILAVGLWAFVALIAGVAYPAFVQRFQVVPAESSKEEPYITNNIAATRDALGLDNVEVKPFDYTQDQAATGQAVAENPETVRNIRLLDPAVVMPTYQRLQSSVAPYRFNDLDVDRYQIKDPEGNFSTTQVVLSNRDLSVNDIPQQSWEGRHLAYTHGYGLALSAANATTDTGRPDFLVRDIPVVEDHDRIDLTIDQPQVYYGENIAGYSIVGTDRQEVDYPGPDGVIVPTEYKGSGGVELSSWVRKVAFAARFSDWNLAISSFVTPQSKILYMRDINERVRAAAPFLHYDADPYPVVTNGRIVYMVDAYTGSDNYPNAQQYDNTGLPPKSGLNTKFNYVRNSVKAVVDTYDGSVKFYVIDPDDPIANAYQKAFPALFADGDQMPEDLRAHLRYPEDLFRAQTQMWARYHLDDANEFYSRTTAWSVAQDPGAAVSTAASSGLTPTVTTPSGQTVRTKEPRIDPYYLLMRLPQEANESFLILRSYVPFSEDDSKKKLTAFMVAKSDPGQYGRLVVYEMPTEMNIDGPAIANSTIQADEQVSQRITILNQQGSKVQYGNLILIPIKNSILYVRPLYVSSEGQTPLPELKNVIVVSGQQVVIRPTLREALQAMFPGVNPETFEQQKVPDTNQGGQPDNGSGTTTTTQPGGTTTTTQGEPSQNQTAEQLFASAQQQLAQAELDLKTTGDLGAYQRAVQDAEAKLQQALNMMSASSTTTSQPPDQA